MQQYKIVRKLVKPLRLFCVCFCFAFLYFQAHSSNFLKIGEDYYSQKNYKKAQFYFQKAIDSNLKIGKPYFFIGMIYDFQKKYYESIQYFQRAVIFPLESKYEKIALWKLIYYYEQVQDYKKVLEYISLLEKDVQTENLKKLKIKAKQNYHYRKSPEPQKGRQFFSKYIRFYNKLNSKINLKKKCKLTKTDKRKLSINFDYLKSAIRINKTFMPYAFSAGSFLKECEEYALSKKFYLLSANKKMKSKVYYKIGILEKKQGNFRKAIQYFKKVFLYKNTSQKIKNYTYINIAQSMMGLSKYKNSYKYLMKRISTEKSNNTESSVMQVTYCIGYLKSISSNRKLLQRFRTSNEEINEIDLIFQIQKNLKSTIPFEIYQFCDKLHTKILAKEKKIVNQTTHFLYTYFTLHWNYLQYLIYRKTNIYAQFQKNILEFYFSNRYNNTDFSNSLKINSIIQDTPWILNSISIFFDFFLEQKDNLRACFYGYAFRSYIIWKDKHLLKIANVCESIKEYAIAFYFYQEIVSRDNRIEKIFLNMLFTWKGEKVLIQELESYFSTRRSKKKYIDIINYINNNKKFPDICLNSKLKIWFQKIHYKCKR